MEEVVAHHLETAFHLGAQPGVGAAELAALGELAATHLASAGKRAFALDDAVAAASLFERAMACLPVEEGLRADLARWRGAALFDLGRFDEAREVLVAGLAASRASGDEALRWRLKLELMELDVYTRPGDRGAAETQAFAEEAVDALTGLADLAGLARAYRLLGEALTLQGRLDEGIEAFGRGARFALEAGDEREVALPQQLMGLHGTTPLPVFIAQCEQLISNRARRPRPEVVMRLAYAWALTGDEARARPYLDEGLALARDVGGAFRVADAELYAGLTLLALEQPSAAADLLVSSANHLTQIGESNLRSTVEGFLGEAQLRCGRMSDAAAAAHRCKELAAGDDWASQLLWRQVSAKVHAARGDLRVAQELISEAAAIADSTDFLAMAAAVHLDAAALFSAAGHREEAHRETKLAHSLFMRKGVLAGATTRAPANDGTA